MRRVLVPFDMSANAVTALDYALQFCDAFGITLQVFHVSDKSPYLLAAGAGEKDLNERILKDQEEKKDAIRQTITERSGLLGVHLPAERIAVQAEYNPLVVEKIIEVAQQSRADLIIMGTHGAGGIAKFLFGSNTSAMISKSLIPVLAVPGNCVYKPVARVVYASDMERLQAELKIITGLLRGIHPAIEVVHFDFGTGKKNLPATEINAVIRQTGYSPINLVTQKTDMDKPLLHHIRQYARRQQPAWVLMYTKERSFWQKLFAGSKTEDLAYSLEFPLLSIRKPE